MKQKYYLGLDLSLTHTGVVIVDKDGSIRKKEVVKSSPNGPRPIDELDRLNDICARVHRIYSTRDISIAAIEGLAFAAKNTSALVQLSGLNYFIRDQLSSLEIPFVIVAPTTLKKFVTGSGNSEKSLMMLEIHKRWGEYIDENNAADAYGLARIAHAIDNSKGYNKQQIETATRLKNAQL